MNEPLPTASLLLLLVLLAAVGDTADASDERRCGRGASALKKRFSANTVLIHARTCCGTLCVCVCVLAALAPAWCS